MSISAIGSDAPLPAPRSPSHRTRKVALKLRPAGIEPPTAERIRQAPVEIVADQDPDGQSVHHWKGVDMIQRLARKGLVEEVWLLSVDRFRRDYRIACFDPLAATDLARVPGGGGEGPILDRVEDARQRVHEALRPLGGASSPAGSVVWFVVGAERSLREWSLRQGWGGGRPIRQEVATGILVAALGALHSHYTGEKRRNASVDSKKNKT